MLVRFLVQGERRERPTRDSQRYGVLDDVLETHEYDVIVKTDQKSPSSSSDLEHQRTEGGGTDDLRRSVNEFPCQVRTMKSALETHVTGDSNIFLDDGHFVAVVQPIFRGEEWQHGLREDKGKDVHYVRFEVRGIGVLPQRCRRQEASHG